MPACHGHASGSLAGVARVLALVCAAARAFRPSASLGELGPALGDICASTLAVVKSDTVNNECLMAPYILDLARRPTPRTEMLPSSMFTACALRESLEGRCRSLAVGSSSRSAAPFFGTRDGKFVLKVIKPSEMLTLKHLAESTQGEHTYSQHIQRGNTLMVPFIYFVEEENLVVMPSMFSDMEELLYKLYGDGPTPKIAKYDVKPAQVPHSDERALWFAHLSEAGWSLKEDETLVCGEHNVRLVGRARSGPACWKQLEDYANKDVDFLASVRREEFLTGRAMEFVDYSMVFLVTASPGVVETSQVDVPASCVISTTDGNTNVICVRMIDYLMEKTLGRKLESVFKNDKFFQYGETIKLLVRCSGDVGGEGCGAYREIAEGASGDGA